MTNNPMRKRKFDLEERTGKFGEEIIRFARKIPQDPITRPLISQLIRAATSIGANYCEADDAHSKKDFLHKISLCRKESRETKHWLKMIVVATPAFKAECQAYLQEVHELNLIFSAIVNKSRTNQDDQ